MFRNATPRRPEETTQRHRHKPVLVIFVSASLLSLQTIFACVRHFKAEPVLSSACLTANAGPVFNCTFAAASALPASAIMTTVRPQPRQAQQPLLYGKSHQHTPPFTTVTPSPRSLEVVLRENLNRDLWQDGQHTTHQPPPARYAHPLQRAQLYSDTDGAGESIQNGTKLSEHMLRRKTPNGILNAAYDGTSVEQAERPHAMKHILLPVAQGFASDPSAPKPSDFELPLRPPAQTWTSGYSEKYQPLISTVQPMSANQSSGIAHPNSTWTLPQSHVPKIDSVLNQLPVQSTQYQYQHIGPFGFMTPPTGPSFGPTASNDAGPYGPYWPNGTFVPYRPAALRDTRFYPQHTTAWAGFQTPSNLSTPGTLWQNQHAASLGSPGYFGSPKQFQGAAPLDLINAQALTRLDGGMNRRGSGYFGGSHHGLGLNLSGYSSSRSSAVSTPQDIIDGSVQLDSGQTTPKAPTRNSLDLASEFDERSNSAKLREKVLSHAHSVYVDLLQYLHDLRRRSHGRNSNQFVRTSMYPRPPRQPNCDFSKSASNGTTSASRIPVDSMFGTHGQTNNSYNSRVSRQAVSNPYNNNIRPSQSPSTPLNPSPWPSNSNLYGKLERHSSWQKQSPQQPPSLHPGFSPDRLRTLRRMSANSLGLSHLPLRQEGPPTANAITALDNLKELCQESSWQWVEGMLLGGCLAYALADYQKALEWNTAILKIDSKYVDPPHTQRLRQTALTKRSVMSKQCPISQPRFSPCIRSKTLSTSG